MKIIRSIVLYTYTVYCTTVFIKSYLRSIKKMDFLFVWSFLLFTMLIGIFVNSQVITSNNFKTYWKLKNEPIISGTVWMRTDIFSISINRITPKCKDCKCVFDCPSISKLTKKKWQLCPIILKSRLRKINIFLTQIWINREKCLNGQKYSKLIFSDNFLDVTE